MYGPKYVWFLSAPSTASILNPKIFSQQHEMLECDYSEVMKAAEGFVIITKVNIRQDNETTVSGLVSTMWRELRTKCANSDGHS